MISERVLEPLQRGLRERNGAGLHWYAVIDTAQQVPAIDRARMARRPNQTLYQGILGALAHRAAPHLVRLELEDDYTAWLLAHASQHWGILLQSSADLEAVRQHLRKFLVVADPQGGRQRFRFYDPRILRAFLPVCTGYEVAQFFGPVKRYYAVARDPRQWQVYSAMSRGVLSEHVCK